MVAEVPGGKSTTIRTETLTVPDDLRPFVDRFLCTYSDGPAHFFSVIPPTGSIYLTYVYGASMHVRLDAGEVFEPPNPFIGGQVKSYRTECTADGQIGFMGIEFAATGFHRLFHTDCSRLTNRAPGLVDIVPEEAQRLRKDLDRQNGVANRFEVLKQFLRAHTGNALETPRVEEAVRLLKKERGNLTVDELAERCAVSMRHLNRLFLKCVGIGPKAFAKTIQLKCAFEALQDQHKGELGHVAQLAGYYDQAHFAKDFQRLVGANPTGFLDDPAPFLKSFMRGTSH